MDLRLFDSRQLSPTCAARRLVQGSPERGKRCAGLTSWGFAHSSPPSLQSGARTTTTRVAQHLDFAKFGWDRAAPRAGNWPAPRVPTTVSSPVGSTPTTRTPPPPVTGTTTTTVPKFSSFLAQSVDFVTADDGFVLGYLRCGKEAASPSGARSTGERPGWRCRLRPSASERPTTVRCSSCTLPIPSTAGPPGPPCGGPMTGPGAGTRSTSAALW